MPSKTVHGIADSADLATEKEVKSFLDVIAILQPMEAEQRQRILASVAILIGLVSSDTCSAVIAEAADRRRS